MVLRVVYVRKKRNEKPSVVVNSAQDYIYISNIKCDVQNDLSLQTHLQFYEYMRVKKKK